MAIKKFVVGCFDDEAVLFPAVKKVRRAGYKIHDVFTPFPIHGLDRAMGLRWWSTFEKDPSWIACPAF